MPWYTWAAIVICLLPFAATCAFAVYVIVKVLSEWEDGA